MTEPDTNPLIKRINTDLVDAMRAKDKKLVGVLRLITAAIKQIEVDERITVTDERMLIILDKLAKQRKESISQFSRANRDDLVAQEQYELDIINQYLPKPLSDEEIHQLIQETITTLDAKQIGDMGKVMQALKPLLQSRADMSKVSSLIKAKLS